MSFQLLNLHVPRSRPTELKGSLITSYASRDTSISNYTITDPEIVQHIRALVPYSPNVFYTEIYGSFPPHVDMDGGCKINFYLDTCNAHTVFYSSGNPVDQYFFESCQEQSRFTARPYSAWLLDVSKIHSVEMPTPGLRKMITVQYINHTYEDLCTFKNLI